MGDTHIAWTNKTWNPITGCTKVSQGCKHCYAETIARRMWAQQYAPNADGSARQFTDVRLHADRLEMPLHWRKPAMVFVNSMSDLFHEDVPDEFIGDVFRIMLLAKQHTFQILTKRPERMVAWFRDWYANQMPNQNVWLGVSVEDQAAADKRIPLLLQTPAHVRFLSCEPLLGPINLSRWIGDMDCGECRVRFFGDECPSCHQKDDDMWAIGFAENACDPYPDLHWVIIGGESGLHHRPMSTAWAEGLLFQCQAAGVACFVKQMGGTHPGTEMEDLPPALRVREFPTVAA